MRAAHGGEHLVRVAGLGHRGRQPLVLAVERLRGGVDAVQQSHAVHAGGVRRRQRGRLQCRGERQRRERARGGDLCARRQGGREESVSGAVRQLVAPYGWSDSG
jgi:hypothetical protein